MSMSTQHGGGATRRPSSTTPGGKPKDSAGTGATPKKTGTPVRSSGPAKSGGGKGGGGKGPRKPIAPVKVGAGRPWGAIALFTTVGVIAFGIIGFGAFQVFQNSKTWEDRAAAVSGIQNYRKSNPKMLTSNHKPGKLTYTMTPPVGGDHNQNWQRCLGDVYNAPIATEHAVHSMEHGAVWITYQADLPKAEVDALAKKVKGHDFTLMSPIEGQKKPISVQTWGYQLSVDKASDPRIDQFIKALREVSAKEQGATCSSGAYITETGTTPRDLAPPQQQQPGVPGQGG
jgi:hypothetical protein